MPRRSSTRTTTLIDPPPHNLSPAPPPTHSLPDNLINLRNQWKWAAFSQFLFTFSHLFAMDDLSLVDIENDLTRSTNIVLPRIMQRLLYTLSYDRKISLGNWQTALRKQYHKRDPQANPLGPEPLSEYPGLPSDSVEPEANSPEPDQRPKAEETHDSTGQDLPRSTEHSSLAPETTRENTAEGSDRKPSFPPETSAGAARENTVPEHSVQRDAQKLVEGPETETEVEREESKDWFDLPMLVKLDSMHLLTEWQFQNPLRLRSLMKNDDEAAQWRIEPIGYDAKRNAYWLIGADRLWIQRVLPKPLKSNLKRKRPDLRSSLKSKPKQATKRPRLQSESTSSSTAFPKPPTKGKAGTQNSPLSTSGAGRAAKAQAKLKLDAQAKELAELNRQAATLTSGSTTRRSSKRQKAEPSPSTARTTSRRPLGTRLSARLRGTQEEEWQPVPEEWLNEDTTSAEGIFSEKKEATFNEVQNKTSGREKRTKPPKTGLESDVESISDLTELSEDIEEERNNTTGGEVEDYEVEKEDEDVTADTQLERNAPADDRGLDDPPTLPDGFIEWETICATLYEWEHIAERFEKATHYSEKALYKVLVNDIVPLITEELKEIDRKRRLEDALVHRKRSSRIAIKESEKEEARMAAKKRADEQEKMSRARRLEIRLQKEEADRVRRESAREQRRKEREAKEGLQKQEGGESSDIPVDIVGDGHVSTGLTNGTMTFHQGKLRFNGNGSAMKGPGSGSRTPVGDDWELDCEICRRHGINLDDGTPMMCCGSCSKWQHIACHDHADYQAGRQKRNWDEEEFICRQCRSRRRPNREGLGVGGYLPPQQQQINRIPYLPLRPPLATGAPHNPYIQSPANYTAARATDSHSGTRNNVGNGVTPYAQPIRLALPPAPAHIQPYQQQTTIAFTHYQPQQRGFSSSSQVHQPYGSPAPTQSYSQSSPSQFSQRSTSGANGQMPQSYPTGWNVATPANPSGGRSPMYNGSAERASLYRQEPEWHYAGRPDVALVHTQWQPPNPHSNDIPSPLPTELSLNQLTTQFRYHPTSYQSPS